MGDCFGAPFEADVKVSKSILNSYFKRLLDPDLKGIRYFLLYFILYKGPSHLYVGLRS